MVSNRANLWPEITYDKLRYGALGGQHFNCLLMLGRTAGCDPGGRPYDFEGEEFTRWCKHGNRYVVLSEHTTREEAYPNF